MNAVNGSGPSGLAEVLAALDVLTDNKRVQVESLRQELRSHEAELRRLQAMRRAAEPPQEKVARPRRVSRYGEEELAILLTRIRELPAVVEDVPGSFTTPYLADQLGLDRSKAERVVTALRDREQIRMVGERQIGRGARKSRLFVIDDA